MKTAPVIATHARKDARPDPVAPASRRCHGAVDEIPVGAIEPNPFQPRFEFPAEALEELAASVKRHGVLQPLTVRPSEKPGRYELVLGERRLRAARKAGLATVPCVVAAVPDRKLLELALVENLQRADLDPVETASAYRALMERCRYTQEELAARLSVSRPGVANALRLLELPEALRAEISKGRITAGHARALVGLKDEEAQKALAERVVEEGLSVRDVERAVAREKSARRRRKPAERPGYLEPVERRLERHFGTKVRIELTGKTRGRIVLDFYGEADFERLLGMFE